MSKYRPIEESEVEKEDKVEEVNETNKVEEKTEKKKDKKDKKVKKEKKAKTKKSKEVISELKKVTWPTFKDVVKKTGVVLAFVLAFGAVLLLFDVIFSLFHNLLIG